MITLTGRTRQPQGAGKARITGLKIGEVLVEPDAYEINKWRAMASKYQIGVVRVPEGLKRVR